MPAATTSASSRKRSTTAAAATAGGDGGGEAATAAPKKRGRWWYIWGGSCLCVPFVPISNTHKYQSYIGRPPNAKNEPAAAAAAAAAAAEEEEDSSSKPKRGRKAAAEKEGAAPAAGGAAKRGGSKKKPPAAAAAKETTAAFAAAAAVIEETTTTTTTITTKKKPPAAKAPATGRATIPRSPTPRAAELGSLTLPPGRRLVRLLSWNVAGLRGLMRKEHAAGAFRALLERCVEAWEFFGLDGGGTGRLVDVYMDATHTLTKHHLYDEIPTRICIYPNTYTEHGHWRPKLTTPTRIHAHTRPPIQ